MVNLYELLKVNKKSKKKDIIESYEILVKEYEHSEENKTLEVLESAKEILTNDKKREEYNEYLDKIKYSKQFSKVEGETYRTIKGEFTRKYHDIDISFKDIYFDYLKYNKDNLGFKILKSIFCLINFLLFIIIKGLIYGILYFLYLMGDFVSKINGLIMLIAILILLFEGDSVTPNYIPFIPANVECFAMLSIIVFIVEILKHLVLDNSINLYVLADNLENKINIKILN